MKNESRDMPIPPGGCRFKWYIGELARTAGVDAGAFRKPLWVDADDYKIYEHEIGYDYGSLVPFAETGPIMLGSGDTVASVTEMIPDEKTQGDYHQVTNKANIL